VAVVTATRDQISERRLPHRPQSLVALSVLAIAQSVGPDTRFGQRFPVSSLFGAGFFKKPQQGIDSPVCPNVDVDRLFSVHPLIPRIRSHMTRHARSWAIAALAVFVFAGTAAPSFAEIVYNVTNYAAGQNGWSVAGTITTSGIGTITESGITAWNIILSKRDAGSYQFSNTLAGYEGIGFKGLLTASTDTLDLSSDPLTETFLAFSNTDQSTFIVWVPTQPSYVAFVNRAQVFESSIFHPRNITGWTIGATASAVPEIDPATGSSALSLVAGVLAMIEQRRRRATAVA
jgi:hypothetical protein